MQSSTVISEVLDIFIKTKSFVDAKKNLVQVYSIDSKKEKVLWCL